MRYLLLVVSLIFSLSLSANSNIWEGVSFPSFVLKDHKGNENTENNLKGKWHIVYFYPKDKTPGCTVEAQNFTDKYDQFQALNTSILGVSYDDIESHQEFADIYKIPFTLLADTEGVLSKALKVDRILPWPHADRQTFVVDPSGKIVKHYNKVIPAEHADQLLNDLSILIKPEVSVKHE